MITRYVALLRGVNVGRHKRIAMSDLRALLANLGYENVATYLQSGNAIFSAAPVARPLAEDIEVALARGLGLECQVVVRSSVELAAAIAADPLVEVATDPARHLVGFLTDVPDPGGVRAVEALDIAPSLIRFSTREAYLWCPEGLLASPLSKLNWERRLGVSVTMRNWNTVIKLSALAEG